MNQITLKTPAKINLTLDIMGKRPDGYHNIESVFMAIPIYDTIIISKSENFKNKFNKFSVKCNKNNIPCDENNIAYKACKNIEKITGLKEIAENISIYIEKNIPSEAGLGGGSSDAAAVILGLNKMFSLDLTYDEMLQAAAETGADVPFFLNGGTQIAYGTGEILKSVKNNFNCINMVITKGNEGISTASAYKAVDDAEKRYHPSATDMVKSLEIADISILAKSIGNIFTSVSATQEVRDIISDAELYGSLGSEMTGSGSAVFSIFDSEQSAEKFCLFAKEKYLFSEFVKCNGKECININ